MNLLKNTLILTLLISTVFSQSVNIIDNDSNINLRINDEGTAGSSITIPEVGVTLSSTDDKLYHDHDRLTWSGFAIGFVDESGWADGNPTVRLRNSGDNVAIGLSSTTEKLDVNGTINTPEDYKIDGFVFLKNSHSTMLTDYGTLLGAEAGQNFIGSSSNQKIDAIGYRALYSQIDGEYNAAIGWKALQNIIIKEQNTAIGYSAISNSAVYGFNTAVGSMILTIGDTIAANTAIGAYALSEEEKGYQSTAIGAYALNKNKGYKLDSRNTAAGAECLENNTTGINNVAIGYKAMEDNITGSNNIALGNNAGNSSGAGSANSGNVFIGYSAGADSVVNNKLIIDNSIDELALIWGDFTDGSEVVLINGDLEYTGNLTHVSDISLKQNIVGLNNNIENVKLLNGVSFDWTDYAMKNVVSPNKPQIGVIAQEVENVYPEIVTANSQGFKGVDYSKLSVILLEVVKEQQIIINELKEHFENVETQLLLASSN